MSDVRRAGYPAQSLPDLDRAQATTIGQPLIENPLSGERIVIVTGEDETDGELLVWDLFLAPGGRVPSSHAHPEQEERFTILQGRMKLRVGGRTTVAGPGSTVTVPPGTVHSFANAGRSRVHVRVETRPALDMRSLLETAAAMAREQQSAGRRLPRLLDLMLFMRDFEHEVRAPYLPAALVRLVTHPLARLARWRGLDASYRRLRIRRTAVPPA
jgi:quercetin dioxygenase-like cupin family protein